MQKLEEKNLKYLVGLAKNRRVFFTGEGSEEKVRLDEVAKSLAPEAFTPVILQLEKSRTVWVSTFRGETIGLEGERSFAIIMNTPTLTEKTEVDYLMTNVTESASTAQWFIQTYSQRNWVEVFYREAFMMVGIKRVSSKR